MKTRKKLSMGVIPSLSLTLIAQGILGHTLSYTEARSWPFSLPHGQSFAASHLRADGNPRQVWPSCCDPSNPSGLRASCEEGHCCQPGSKVKGDWVMGSQNW